MRKKIIKKFIEHPNDVGESYLGHLKFSALYAIGLIRTGVVLIFHGIFPFCFTTYARDKIIVFHNKFTTRNTLINSESANTYLDHENLNLSLQYQKVLALITKLELSGELTPNSIIYKAYSEETSVSLAIIAFILKYKVIITAPQTISLEQIDAIKSNGAYVIICPDTEHDSPENYVNLARILSVNNKYSIYLNQY